MEWLKNLFRGVLNNICINNTNDTNEAQTNEISALNKQLEVCKLEVASLEHKLQETEDELFDTDELVSKLTKENMDLNNDIIELERTLKRTEEDKNHLIYPLKTMRITQTYNGTTSHINYIKGSPKSYPIDDGGNSSEIRSKMYCPCDEMIVKRIYTSGVNTIWLQSTSKVLFANDKEDYAVMKVMHISDSTLAGIKEGQKFTRKQYMLYEGKDGASAYHFHIEVSRGKFKGNGWVKNSKGKWVITGIPIKPEDAFYIDKNFTKVQNKKGLVFKNL